MVLILVDGECAMKIISAKKIAKYARATGMSQYHGTYSMCESNIILYVYNVNNKRHVSARYVESMKEDFPFYSQYEDNFIFYKDGKWKVTGPWQEIFVKMMNSLEKTYKDQRAEHKQNAKIAKKAYKEKIVNAANRLRPQAEKLLAELSASE